MVGRLRAAVLARSRVPLRRAKLPRAARPGAFRAPRTQEHREKGIRLTPLARDKLPVQSVLPIGVDALFRCGELVGPRFAALFGRAEDEVNRSTPVPHLGGPLGVRKITRPLPIMLTPVSFAHDSRARCPIPRFRCSLHALLEDFSVMRPTWRIIPSTVHFSIPHWRIHA